MKICAPKAQETMYTYFKRISIREKKLEGHPMNIYGDWCIFAKMPKKKPSLHRTVGFISKSPPLQKKLAILAKRSDIILLQKLCHVGRFFKRKNFYQKDILRLQINF